MNIRRDITYPEAFRVALPQLAEGEQYIGALGDQLGNLHHVILLPGDNDVADWETQMAWAKSIGGDLPSKTELAMLWGSSRDQFQRDWYWSNQEHELDAAFASYQNFGDGYQFGTHKAAELRARAVRRVPVQSVDVQEPSDGEQRAPAGGDALNDAALQKLFGEAITGALGFGAQGINPPPAGHWLEPFWGMARADAALASRQALLDHPLLREVLAYVEDAGPADVWGAAQSWMNFRDSAIAAQQGEGETA